MKFGAFVSLLKKTKNGDFDSQNCSSGIKILDKFVNKFYRTLLGIPNTSSTVGTHIELGRLPIKLNIFKAMLKYWFHLITLPKSRLVSHCYWTLVGKTNFHDEWISSIKNIIQYSGFCHLWNDQESISQFNPKDIPNIITGITKSLEDQFLQNATAEISSQSKLNLYQKMERTFKVAPYLVTINNRKKRSLFTKLRLGTLKLEVETGRWNKTNKNERFCKLCTGNKVETESHFLFDCPALSDVREPLLNNIFELHPNLIFRSSEDKTIKLFFNECLDIPSLELASTLLYNLISHRDNLLNAAN